MGRVLLTNNIAGTPILMISSHAAAAQHRFHLTHNHFLLSFQLPSSSPRLRTRIRPRKTEIGSERTKKKVFVPWRQRRTSKAKRRSAASKAACLPMVGWAEEVRGKEGGEEGEGGGSVLFCAVIKVGKVGLSNNLGCTGQS